MINYLAKYGVMFVSLVLVQVLILNQVQFSGFFNPYIYVLFVLLFPTNSPKYALLILGFILGFVIDVFTNTLGVHSAATVFIAFIRPGILRLISNREDDRGNFPGLKQNSPGWFITYVVMMVFIHHFILFYLEVYTFSNFFTTFYRIILSTLFSSVVIVLSQFLVFKE
jgi:hypothetical protein